MADQVRFRLDDHAVAAITALRRRAADTGSAAPDDEPAVVAASAAVIPPPARAALAEEVRRLARPSVWLATLGTVAGRTGELVLAAVVDAELLAVHAAVHDALAGRVRNPTAAYLPGAWLPHVVLTTSEPAAAFAALHPVVPLRARVQAIEVGPSRAWPGAGERARPVGTGSAVLEFEVVRSSTPGSTA